VKIVLDAGLHAKIYITGPNTFAFGENGVNVNSYNPVTGELEFS
jgi:hypothetical protein